MKILSSIFSFVVILTLGCAHKGTKTASADSDGAEKTAEELQEDATIQKYPTTKSDLGSSVDPGDRIDVTFNEETERWVEYFQGRGREHFERYLERSGRYLTLMKKVLRENNVPEDLVYIAMIESGFSGKVKSRARAVGYWQFISATGKHYGLRSNKWMDERWDPVKSTQAAAYYFKGLYNLFGSWYLAIASYNVGENRIKSLVMKNFTRDFWELAKRKQLPSETIHYVPKYLAARQIALEPEKYGFSGINYRNPLVFDVITSKEPVDMKLLAKHMHLDYKELQDLNPAYKTQYMPLVDGEVEVRIPQGTIDAGKLALSESTVKDKRMSFDMTPTKISFLKYKVKRGETVEAIAEQFAVPVDEILKVNRTRKEKIKPGTTLRIPTSAFKIDKNRKHASTSSSKIHTYVVKRGDTLTQIARRHGVSMKQLLKKNRLASGQIQRGQRLVIR